MTHKEKIIYLAGIVDGEGCISIIYQHAGGRLKKYPILSIRVSNTSYKLLAWIKDNFGGDIHELRDNNREHKHYKRCWQWSITWSRARLLVEELAPYLIVKREQVDKVLDRNNYTEFRYN